MSLLAIIGTARDGYDRAVAERATAAGDRSLPAVERVELVALWDRRRRGWQRLWAVAIARALDRGTNTAAVAAVAGFSTEKDVFAVRAAVRRGVVRDWAPWRPERRAGWYSEAVRSAPYPSRDPSRLRRGSVAP